MSSVIDQYRQKLRPDETSWRPRFFEPPDVPELIRSGRVTVIHDSYLGQLRELCETRYPRPAERAELDGFVAEELKGADPDARGAWVFYPWSGRLVHVLAEADYRELRTSRNRYKITADEQSKLQSFRIGIVGLSVGSATAVTLALEEIGGEYRLADFDTLSLSNMNRLRSGVQNVGVNKAVLTAREIFEINPYARIDVFTDGLTAENIDRFLTGGDRLDLLIEECDDLYLKVRLREKARALRMPVLMETSDRGLIDVERFDREPDRPLLHGLIGDVRADELHGLSTTDKVPFVLDILGIPTISERFAASLFEIDRTLRTWPQLASAVALGGALNADAARRIALGQLNASGRFYVDLERIVGESVPSPALPLAPLRGGGHPVEQHTERRDGLSPGQSRHPTAPSPERSAAVRSESGTATAARSEGEGWGGDSAGELPDTPPKLPAATQARLSDDDIRALVRFGVLAPSGGNSQPWRFEWDGQQLRCSVDESRIQTLLDTGGYAAQLALGAAVENISLAAAAIGWRAEVHPSPGAIFALTFTRTAASGGVEAVIQRVTNRRLAPREPLLRREKQLLADAANRAGAHLHIVDDSAALAEVGRILGEGDRLRLLHERTHRDMMSEIRWTSEEALRTRDGLDVRTLELNPTDAAAMRLTARRGPVEQIRRWGLGSALTEQAAKSIAAASAAGLLVIPSTDAEAYFAGGRAMEQVWLAATALGLAFQPMTSLLYIAKSAYEFAPWEREALFRLGERYRAVFNPASGTELMLFRLARAPAPTARSIRRNVGDVLQIEPHA